MKFLLAMNSLAGAHSNYQLQHKTPFWVCPCNESPLYMCPPPEPGCSQCHRGITMGDWRDPLDPDLDAQILFSQFLLGRAQMIRKFMPGQHSWCVDCSFFPFPSPSPSPSWRSVYVPVVTLTHVLCVTGQLQGLVLAGIRALHGFPF